MVTIQPFEYEKTTAFKERVQIANKVNEIINLFNELDIESKINVFNEEIVIINGKITEINNALNDVNAAVNTVEGYNTRLTSVENESISLDARLDNLENKDLENVKLSGNQTIENIKTFSSSPIVPNPPNGDTSTKAVNTNWVSQTGDDAPNNIMHRYGNETVSGVKTYSDRIIGTVQLSNVVGNYGYNGWYKAIDLGNVANSIQTKIIVFSASYRCPTQYAELFISNNDVPQIKAVVCKGIDTTHADLSNYGVMLENNHVIFYAKKIDMDMALVVNVEYKTSYGVYTNSDISVLAEQTTDPTGLSGFISATAMIG